MGWKDKYGTRGTRKDGLFVKLANGESVDFVVPEDSDPYESVTKWNGEKSEKCDKKDPDAQVKILLAVFVTAKRAKGAKTSDQVQDAKILRLTPSTFDMLTEAIDDDSVGGTEQVYRLKRTGEGLETRYGITRIDRASPELLRTVRDVSLPDLGPYGELMQAAPEPAARADAPPPEADIPF